jgi:hypothetical protein
MHVPRIVKLCLIKAKVLGAALTLTLLSVYLFITLNNASMKNDQLAVTSMKNDQLAVTAIEKDQLAVIFAESPDMDITWIKQFPAFDFHLFPFKSPQKEMDGRIPVNRGKEAMTYLTFIIQNYEKLPEKMAFIHGHHTSWHQKDKVWTFFQDIQLSKLNSYFNFRACEYNPSKNIWKSYPSNRWRSHGTPPQQQATYKKFWQEFNMTGKYGFPDIVSKGLNTASYCCAQFFVTKKQILNQPKEFYIDLRKWLINTPMEDYYSSRVLEYLWSIIFTSALEEPIITDDQCNTLLIGSTSRQR